MPALRPTPTTAPLVERQPLDVGGAIVGGAQTGIAGVGGAAATAVSGGGEAMSQVAAAPNAALSAGTGVSSINVYKLCS